jgi:hypothetical protein
MKLGDYYLDLDKVSALKTQEERNDIHNYYRDMMYAITDNLTDRAKGIHNTLTRGGYLKNLIEEEREEKIVTILG